MFRIRIEDHVPSELDPIFCRERHCFGRALLFVIAFIIFIMGMVGTR